MSSLVVELAVFYILCSFIFYIMFDVAVYSLKKIRLTLQPKLRKTLDDDIALLKKTRNYSILWPVSTIMFLRSQRNEIKDKV